MSDLAFTSDRYSGKIRSAYVAIACILGTASASPSYAMPMSSWMFKFSASASIDQIQATTTCSKASPSTSDLSANKMAAILGGAASKFEAITAQQSNTTPVVAALSSFQANRCIEQLNSSASLQPAPAQAEPTMPAEVAISERITPSYAPQDSSKPNIFGSVATTISRTPFDGKWNVIRGNHISGRTGPWAHIIRASRHQSQSQKIEAVNQWVNARVQYRDDRARDRAGRADQWKSAQATLTEQFGDCEDYAIAKMKLLEAAGVAQSDMFLVIAHDLVRRADHALLVVKDRDRLVVLDNNTNVIVDANQAHDYRPLISYSGNNSWVHGYRRTTPAPFQVAVANTTFASLH